MKKRAFTLIELLLVMLIFTFLFAAILSVIASSDRSWRAGYNKLAEQQEARKAMDDIVKLLRQSNPDWIIDGLHYPVAITGSNRVDFYLPVFDAQGTITALKKVTFKINPDNTAQLLRKIGTSAAVVVANDISSISFAGGCAACSSITCSNVADDCPVVEIVITTAKNTQFTLQSRVSIRNVNVPLEDDVIIEEPEQGEF